MPVDPIRPQATGSTGATSAPDPIPSDFLNLFPSACIPVIDDGSQSLKRMQEAQTIEEENLPVAEARQGVPDAWDTLFHRHQAGLCAFAVRMLKDEHSALDVLQETFLSAIRHIGTLREEGRFGPWIYGIAYQKCLQHLRKARPVHSLDTLEELDSDASSDPSPEQVLIRKEEESAFLALIDELPVAHRTCVLLFYLENFPLEEIARLMETRVGTVKSRLHYARKTLRKRLEHGV